MRTFWFSSLLIFIASGIQAQLHIQMQSDGPWTKADSTFEVFSTAFQNLTHVNGLVIQDSIILTQTESGYEVKSVSARINREVQELLAGINFGQSPPHRMAWVAKPDMRITKIHFFQRIFSSEMCKAVNGNLLFYKSCMEYEVDRANRLIFNPDDLEALEGAAQAKVIVNKYGKAVSIGFGPLSSNSALNDYIIQEISRIEYPPAGMIEGDTVAYEFDYKKSFFAYSDDSVGTKAAFKQAIEDKQFAQAVFAMEKMIKQNWSCDSLIYYQAGWAAWQLNEREQARTFFTKIFPQEVLKDKLVLVESGETRDAPVVRLVDSHSGEGLNYDRGPLFPGCDGKVDNKNRNECFQRGMMTHISRQFRYPTAARNEGISGRVFVNFEMDTNGKVQKLRVVRTVHYLIDLEALRVVSELPKMDEPAMLKGKSVRISYTLPINAKIH
jgi:TonB family protein